VKQIISFSDFELNQTRAKEFTDANKNHTICKKNILVYVPPPVFQFYMWTSLCNKVSNIWDFL